jgi:hypothetical protein
MHTENKQKYQPSKYEDKGAITNTPDERRITHQTTTGTTRAKPLNSEDKTTGFCRTIPTIPNTSPPPPHLPTTIPLRPFDYSNAKTFVSPTHNQHKTYFLAPCILDQYKTRIKNGFDGAFHFLYGPKNLSFLIQKTKSNGLP